MSGSAKKRRNKNRHWLRRRANERRRFENACDLFEEFYPGGVEGFNQQMIAIDDAIGTIKPPHASLTVGDVTIDVRDVHIQEHQ